MNPSLEEARVLLRKAEGDSRAAEQLAKSPSQALWIVGFHAQQAVEKALKAVLASRLGRHQEGAPSAPWIC